MAPRIESVSVQGFRSFGASRQSVELSESVTVLWGGNSQGKTSLVEAIEFLLTGDIARRELMAGSKDEFAEALRNAHIDPRNVVEVEATIMSDGVRRKVTRTLRQDYSKSTSTGARSDITIDGQPAQETDIERVLGVHLSAAPLRAPVLAQHTLAYVFSTSPTDRALYFRALLDTADVDEFRTAVNDLKSRLPRPSRKELIDLATVEDIDALKPAVTNIRAARNEQILVGAVKHCLDSLTGKQSQTLESAMQEAAAMLEARRSLEFPVSLFDHPAAPSWQPVADFDRTIQDFEQERAKVADEAERLVSLFGAALNVVEHSHPTGASASDCPLCSAVGTLTAQRVAFIREQVQANEAFTLTLARLRSLLNTAVARLNALGQGVKPSLPAFARLSRRERVSRGFTVATLSRHVEDNRESLGPWFAAYRDLRREARTFAGKIKHVTTVMTAALASPRDLVGADAVGELAALTLAHDQYTQCLKRYEDRARPVIAAAVGNVDRARNLQGWDALLRLAADPEQLWSALLELRAYEGMQKAIDKSVTEIDFAIGNVSDEKFADLSDDVKKWWDLLRPDEPAFFDGVKRRSATSKRNVDLKVGLSAFEDRSNPQLRDAIAVLSQSQLHCLGLSLFLARAIRDDTGFVVMDDPVLSSDDDYRPNFTASVIEALVQHGMQVVMTTQDHKSWKDIGHRWEHVGARQFIIVRDDPRLGTQLRGDNDALAEMIAKVAPGTKSNDPAVRKDSAGKLRQILERIAKTLLVNDRKRRGDQKASITDYDGKNFGEYYPSAKLLLNRDPSHPGKLTSAYQYVTPGPHDDTPPNQSELAMVLGDVRRFVRDYSL